MDTAVALVQSYLYMNGYFTVTEYPVLELNPGLADRDFDQRNKEYDFMLINQR